jgi:hypothetical protein
MSLREQTRDFAREGCARARLNLLLRMAPLRPVGAGRAVRQAGPAISNNRPICGS